MIDKLTGSRGGETGRHARLKIWWALARAGSIPALGTSRKCGSSSVVEHDLAKVGVAGSTPVSRSIVILLFTVFYIVSPLQAQIVQLKSHYFVESNTVRLPIFVPGESNVTLFRLQEGRTLWRIPAFKVREALKGAGYDTEPPPSSLITFERAKKRSFPKLQRVIAEKYERHYPTLKIGAVSIKPTGSGAADFSFGPDCTLRMSRNGFRKKSGTFTVRCKKRVHYFRYTIDGTIMVYKANHQIKKDKIIDSKSVHAEYVPFEKLFAPPVTDFENGRYIARLNIPASKILTTANTEPLPAVLKNSSVRCIYRAGSVLIEFDATALQNGRIGDRITVKKSDGKVLRGMVVEKMRVEIE